MSAGPPIGGNPAGSILTADVIDLLLSLFPRGFARWSSVRFATSNVYKLIAGVADSLKTYGFDQVDTFRQEMNPATAIQKLPDWEIALGLTTTPTARSGTSAQRQSGVISKLRESGAFTISNVRSIIAPLLGYTDASALNVIECSRSGLKTAHTYAYGANFSWANLVNVTINVRDNGVVSAAGAQVVISGVVAANWPFMQFTLTRPGGTGYTWPLSVVARASNGDLYLNAPYHAGASIHGDWVLQVADLAAGAGSATDWSLFVEGIAPNQETGGAIFDWGVYADPALIVGTPDYVSVRQAVARIEHGHTVGNLLQSIAPYPNTDSGVHAAIPNECIPT